MLDDLFYSYTIEEATEKIIIPPKRKWVWECYL